MEQLTDIQKELTELSMLVAGIPRINVFTVPFGYFESIVPTVLSCLQEEAGHANLQTPLADNSVPAGYFDQLADSILGKIKQESNNQPELSPLLEQIRHQQVFTVPPGYFDKVSSNILQRINADTVQEEIQQLSPLLAGLQRVNVFKLPAGYFEGLENTLSAGITNGIVQEADTEILSEQLMALKSINVFNVPDGYFDSVAANVFQQVSIAPVVKGRVISMRSSRIIKYAVAALFTGAMALGLYKYLGNDKDATPSSNTMATLDAAIQKGSAMNEQQFDAALAQLTVTDITKYLERNGDYTDMAVIKTTLDASTLPSEEDYLTNEGALEEYITEINETQLNN